MRELRKLSDIWKEIDDKRIESKMKEFAWKQSYEGIKAAIEYIGLKLETTKNELDTMEIPVNNRDGKKRYNQRNIKVSKNGIISTGRISDLITGKNSLKTKEEMNEIYKNVGVTQSLKQPKGITTSQNVESKAIDDLDILIGLSEFVSREHLFENRLYDMSYCMIDDIDGHDRTSQEVFVADQVKSSGIRISGQVFFSMINGLLNVGKMISILENGSLTCIGKNQDDKVDVVWFFYGVNDIDILKGFKITQIFAPILHLQVKSYNEFTNKMNDPMFRFDVGKSPEECNRLLEKKLEFIKYGNKHSLTFWNEDDSQIPCENHRIEQRSMNMTRTACNTIDIKVEKKHEDSYGPVDFVVNNIVKVQDKVEKIKFKMRGSGRLPYNPDDIDIFQVSNLVNNEVYAIPMRVIKDNGVITSFFTSEQLMKTAIRLSVEWKEIHKKFKHDFKTQNGVISYVKACEEASKVPELTDRDFYKNLIDENKDKFGSLKQLADRKSKNLNNL